MTNAELKLNGIAVCNMLAQRYVIFKALITKIVMILEYVGKSFCTEWGMWFYAGGVPWENADKRWLLRLC